MSDEASADAGTERDVEDRLGIAACAETRFAESRNLAIVVYDRGQTECLLESGSDLDVFPSGFVQTDEWSARLTVEPSTVAEADGGERCAPSLIFSAKGPACRLRLSRMTLKCIVRSGSPRPPQS